MHDHPLILGIETTCDETAAAVIAVPPTGPPAVVSSVVASQADLHARYGGVVPEIASRQHLEHVLPVIDDALRQADVTADGLAAVAVAYTPGLVGAILVGLSTAKALSLALEVPLIGVDHLEGHVYACRLTRQEDVFPCVGFVVSGGHTNLFDCPAATGWELVGATQDDAAGEAFDKVAAMLDLGYPGGPVVEQAAKAGDPTAYRFPRTFLRDDTLDFSFSGLKTSVLYQVFGQDRTGRVAEPRRRLSEQETADVAASFQAAVVDVLVAKAELALSRTGHRTLCLAGGVAANAALRDAMAAMADRVGADLVVPPLAWCTDNAALAAVAAEKFRVGRFDGLDLDAVPGLVRR